MSYEVADIQTYQWLNATFGATTVTNYIVGPKGKVGIVREIFVDVLTSLVGTTTVPEIDIGISSGDATFGRYRLGNTISLGFPVGPHSASQENIQGNPPRVLSDYAGHVVLDGGPLTSSGIAGGSFSTLVPKGRIPASGFQVTNVINGTGNTDRIFLNGSVPAKDLIVGMAVTVQGVVGVNATINALQTISAIDTTNFQWIEVTGLTFSGTYTGGGIVFLNVVVTSLLGVGGTPAGGGHVRVKIQWIGAETP